MKKLTITILFAVLLSATIVFAAASNYYGKVLVYFNVPSDATFAIAFPSAYTFEDITSSTESSPTVTSSWISFNFTSGTQSWVQPQTNGSATNAQNGPTKPIFYIDNTGNVNEKFDINATVPSTFAVCANSTCTGECGTTTSACTALTTSYVTMATAVTTTSFLNITLYANASGSSGGQASGSVMIKSTAV